MTQNEIDRAEERAPELRGIEAINLDGFSCDPEDYAALERTLRGWWDQVSYFRVMYKTVEECGRAIAANAI